MIETSEDKSKKFTVKLLIKEIIIWIVEIIIVIGIAWGIINYCVEKTIMLGNSMEMTLDDKDTIILNKFIYKYSKPKRFDVVVFKQNGKEHSYYNIKRIIGLPNETIQIIDGKIYINGEIIDEKISVEAIKNAGLAEEEIILDDNEYFVLGDNRNNSEDSRFASIGNIVKDDIIGKAWLKVEPDFAFISKLNLKDDNNIKKDDTVNIVKSKVENE